MCFVAGLSTDPLRELTVLPQTSYLRGRVTKWERGRGGRGKEEGRGKGKKKRGGPHV